MNLLSFLREKAGFTRNEVKVVLFLSVTFLIGLGVRWLAPAETAPASGTPFDYTLLDSEFAARSQSPDSPAAGAGAALTSRAPAKSPPADGVNLNSASEQDLIALPGIGPATAARILQYRDEHGEFTSVDQLLQVPGIGTKKLERLRPYVRVH